MLKSLLSKAAKAGGKIIYPVPVFSIKRLNFRDHFLFFRHNPVACMDYWERISN